MMLLSLQLHRLGYTKGCRDTHRGVSSAKVIVLALGHARETTDAATLTI
jgi:hypothetical protein